MPKNQNIKKVSKVARLLGETCNQRNMRTDITKILQCVFICFDFCLSGTLGQEAPIRFSRSFTLDAHKNITSVYHKSSNEKGVFHKVLVFLKFQAKNMVLLTMMFIPNNNERPTMQGHLHCINCHLYLLLGKSSLVTFEPFEVGELHLQLEFELESHFFAPSPPFTFFQVYNYQEDASFTLL